MITDIKSTNSSTVKYTDEAESYFINVSTNEDNIDYVDVSFCGINKIIIPKGILPELAKILNQFK